MNHFSVSYSKHPIGCMVAAAALNEVPRQDLNATITNPAMVCSHDVCMHFSASDQVLCHLTEATVVTDTSGPQGLSTDFTAAGAYEARSHLVARPHRFPHAK
jgi:hypothetical protein